MKNEELTLKRRKQYHDKKNSRNHMKRKKPLHLPKKFKFEDKQEMLCIVTIVMIWSTLVSL